MNTANVAERTDAALYDSHVLDMDRESWMSLRRKNGDLLASALIDSVRTSSLRCATADDADSEYVVKTVFSIVIDFVSLSESEMWLRLVTETDAVFSCAMRYLSFDNGMWRDKTAVFDCHLEDIEIYSDSTWCSEPEKNRPFMIELQLEAKEDGIDFSYVSDIENVEAFEKLHSEDKISNRLED